MNLQDFPSLIVNEMQPGPDDIRLHVINTVLPVLCDDGRNTIFFAPELAALAPGLVTFVARFSIDYHTEMHWEHPAEIGTGIRSIGRSSLVVSQVVFQHGKCVASAETVMVQVELATSRSVPITEIARQWFAKFMLA